MKVIVLFALFSATYAAPYVFDYIKVPLNADEVAQLLAKGGFPIINSIPADAQNFDCGSKKQSGFYADTKYQCQIFHRCDVNGNHTVYTCVNSTVFNQLTLTCDYWYNVDCNRAKDFEDFANSRLYNPDMPLFDSPPADYVAPSQKGQQASAAVPVASKPAAGNKPKATKAPPKGSVQVGGSVSIQSRANDENAGGAAADSNEAGSNTSQDATPAASEATTQAAEGGESTAETTSQASS